MFFALVFKENEGLLEQAVMSSQWPRCKKNTVGVSIIFKKLCEIHQDASGQMFVCEALIYVSEKETNISQLT